MNWLTKLRSKKKVEAGFLDPPFYPPEVIGDGDGSSERTLSLSPEIDLDDEVESGVYYVYFGDKEALLSNNNATNYFIVFFLRSARGERFDLDNLEAFDFETGPLRGTEIYSRLQMADDLYGNEDRGNVREILIKFSKGEIDV